MRIVAGKKLEVIRGAEANIEQQNRGTHAEVSMGV